MIVLDICLSEIPKEMIHKAKNGKSYCKMIVAGRREPDRYGNDQTIFMSTPKEDKSRPKIYVGAGKTVVAKEGPAKQDQAQQPDQVPGSFNDIAGDLPF